MKPTEYTITSPSDRIEVLKVIEELPEDERWTVKVWPWKQKKTSAQRRLNWKWNTEIGEQTGMTKEEVHYHYKSLFLWKIFYRDDPGYARMIDSVVRVKETHPEEFKHMKAFILSKTHAEDCDVDQMAEFLTDIKRDCHEKEIRITIPRDKEWEWISEISEEKADQIKRATAARPIRGSDRT